MPAGIVQGQTFPNNAIPDCMISSNATVLLGAGIFPLPSGGPNSSVATSRPPRARTKLFASTISSRTSSKAAWSTLVAVGPAKRFSLGVLQQV